MKREILPVTAAQQEALRKRLVRRAWELMDEIDAGLHSGGLEAAARDSAELREIRAALARMDAESDAALKENPSGERQ
jgi:methylmalonyl-CoA mutase N-terminal domain/subunit